MDNCWDTPSAIKNINNLISLKNVEYHCEVSIGTILKPLKEL